MCRSLFKWSLFLYEQVWAESGVSVGGVYQEGHYTAMKSYLLVLTYNAPQQLCFFVQYPSIWTTLCSMKLWWSFSVGGCLMQLCFAPLALEPLRHWILSNVQAFIVLLVCFHRSFIKVIFHRAASPPVVGFFCSGLWGFASLICHCHRLREWNRFLKYLCLLREECSFIVKM